MHGRRTRRWDSKQIMIIVLAVVITLLVGLILGFIVTGGLSDDPVAAGTTTAPGAGETTTTAPGGPTSTVQQPGQLTIPASEDTYVNAGAPEEINGLEESLEVENEDPEILTALIRFEVSGLPEGETIQSATLRLLVVADTEDPVTVHQVEGEWSQADTNQLNAPAVGAQVAAVPPGAPDGTEVDIDVTDVFQGAGRYDFYLQPTGDDGAEFASIESGNPPLLILDWGDGSSASSSDTVIELSGGPAVLVGAGDIADCGEKGDSATAELLDQVVAEHGDAIVFTAGDNVYSSGTPEEFADCYDPTWGRHKERTRPSPGNHDYNTDDATGYFEYFGEAAGSQGKGYYGYMAGEWHVLVLNSNCDDIGGCEEGSPQERWLREQLEASDAACTLAYWHHPVFSSGDHGGDPEVLPLFRALYEDGAELAITGHDHDYERFAPQDPDGTHDPVSGVRQFVVGTGGKGTRDFDTIDANSETRFTDAFGVLELDLFSDGYEWEFIPESRSSFTDVGIEACH